MNFYSLTINVSPFVKHSAEIIQAIFPDQNVPNQFTKLSLPQQEIFLQYIVDELHKLFVFVVRDWVFEPTKRGDHHYHALIICPQVIKAHTMSDINALSAKYGKNKYNRAIDVQCCTDGGGHWTNYIHKMDAKAPATPKDSPIGSPRIFSRLYQKDTIEDQ